MYICFRNGRLGNQLFIYASLLSIKKNNEKIILVGFSELKDAISEDSTNNTYFFLNSIIFKYLKYPYLKKINFDYFLQIISKFLLYKRIFFDELRETYQNNKLTIKKYKKKINYYDNLFIVNKSFFQSEQCIKNNNLKQFNLKKKYYDKSKNIFDKINNKNPKIFIHIRKKDYELINHNQRINVPIDWYKKCINIMKKKYKNPFFIFCTDDKKIYKYFKNLDKCFFSNEDYLTDLAIIAQCNGGILSPSSFSWWGAWLSNRNTNSKIHQKIFLAPEYWMGFNKNEWFPKNIKTSYIDYIKVDS